MALVRMLPMFPGFGDLDKFFDEISWPSVSGLVPALDIYQTKDHIVIETPLAGINPEKVNLSIENDVLTIEGNSEQKTEVDDKDYYRKEVRCGSFHRSVALPAAVNGDKAKATYEKGVLKVIIPKDERAKPKTVRVEVK
ncbi:MAG: Hsp20/alpha crystallin family protein [Patescibacteria group bacterium]